MIQLDLYLNQLTNFLRTVTIKNPYFAESIKERTMASRGISSLSDELNPYYLNLSGEYALEDELMYLLSIDTGELVLLDKDFSINHPKTTSNYKLPNSKYFDLCAQYPLQTDLIKSIIYPVDRDIDIINAVDFTVLKYDASILSESERESMVHTLYSTVAMFRTRWIVKEFVYEEYYPAIAWAALWYSLYINLLVQRIRNLRTRSVHPLHIWEYLQSKGLKEYRSILNTSQQLFLYKNINYLLKNKGKTSNLQILSEELLSSYGVSLNSKSVIQTTTNSIDDCKTTPIIISEDLYSETTPTQNFSTAGFESMETLTARMYIDNLDVSASEATVNSNTAKFEKANKTYTPTKLVELKKLNTNTYFKEAFYKLLLQTLVYNLSQGQLKFNLTFILPLSRTNKTFTLGEAIALMNYCICKERGIIPIDIPTSMFIDSVYKVSPYVIPEYLSIGSHQYKITEILNTEQMLSMLPNDIWPAYTGKTFIEAIDKQFYVLKSHIIELSISGDMVFHRAMQLFYSSIMHNEYITLDLVSGFTTYDDWFESDANLKAEILLQEASSFPVSEYNNLGTQIINHMLPLELSENTTNAGLNEAQYMKMKSLFMQLCSYHIAFLDTAKLVTSISKTTPVVFSRGIVSSGTIDSYKQLMINSTSSSKSSTHINFNPYVNDSTTREGFNSSMQPITTNPIETIFSYSTQANSEALRRIQSELEGYSTTNVSDIYISSKQ